MNNIKYLNSLLVGFLDISLIILTYETKNEKLTIKDFEFKTIN